MGDYDPQNEYERANYDALAKETDRRKLVAEIKKEVAAPIAEAIRSLGCLLLIAIVLSTAILYWLLRG